MNVAWQVRTASEMSKTPLSVLSKKTETPIERFSIKPYDMTGTSSRMISVLSHSEPPLRERTVSRALQP
jgi:hypothetical protein